MSDLRTAAQQALAFTMRDFASLRDFEAAKAVLHDNLRTALAQQDEPVAGCETEADCTSQPWCRIRGECQRKQAEPVRSPSTPQEKEMTDPNSVCFSLNTGAFPVEMLRLDGSGFHYKGKVIEDAGEAYNLFKQWLVMAQQPSQEAEPVAGKVVAWGVFANCDGEWQLQHPVFAGDEQGKVNAEFERASYSGPQPLEVRPLGVVTATAQQAEPVEPVGWNWMLDGQPYGQAYYGNPPDTDIAERAAIAGRTVRLLYTAPPPPQRKPLTEEEIDKIFKHLCNTVGASCKTMARAVERAHGIKE